MSVLQSHYDWQGCISFAFKSGIQGHGFFTHKKTYFWSVRTISVRKIAEVDIARHTREVVSRFLKSLSNQRNNKLLVLPVICKSSVVPVENYSKICEVVTLTHLREFFRQFYSLLLHLKVRKEIRSKLYINPNCCLCYYQPSE